jgi:5'-3' exonuclease
MTMSQRLLSAMMMWLFCSRQSSSPWRSTSTRMLASAFQQAHRVPHRRMLRQWKYPQSGSLHARKRFGLTLDDLDNNDSPQQQRTYKSFDGYEDDIESMAMDYTPDYDDGEEDLGGGSSATIAATVNEKSLQAMKPQPSPESTEVTSEDISVFETASNINTEEPATDRFQSPYEYDEDDEAEPLSPLSHVSAIAEPTHINPVTRRQNQTQPPPSADTLQRQTQPPPKSYMAEQEKQAARPPPNVETKQDSSSPRASTPSPPMPSRDEWRAKYAFLEEDGGSPSSSASVDANRGSQAQEEPPPTQGRRHPPPSELSSTRGQDEIVESKLQVERLTEEIFTMRGSNFNLKSYKQVSLALFGDPDQSTAKEVLEGMASSNILAKLLLEHRQVSQKLSKLEKRQATKHTRVKSILGTSNKPSKTTAGNDDGSPSSPSDSSPLLLLDTSSFIYRAYYSMPPMHRASDGTPCGAVLGFCNMLNRLLLNGMLEGKRPHLVLCKDVSGPTFRNELYGEYKAHRPEAPMDLIPQFELIYQAAAAYGLVQIAASGYEADDVIATLSRQAMEQNIEVDILSGDKDLMQLITNSTTSESDGTVNMIDPMTMTRMTHDTVVEKWGVPAHQLGDVLALAGDTADNIPGVPGIGPKIAANLIQEFNTLEELLNNIDQIKQVKRKENLENFADQARMSQALVKLVNDIPSDRMEVIPSEASSMNFEDFRMEPMNADRILEFYDAMGFFTIKQRLLERLERQERISYQKEQHPQKQKWKTSDPQKQKWQSSRKTGKVEPPKPEDFEGVPF